MTTNYEPYDIAGATSAPATTTRNGHHPDDQDWEDLLAREDPAWSRAPSSGTTPAPEPQPVADLAEQYEPIDWDSLWSDTSDGPDWLVPDVLERGRSHSLTSAAKAGKSLLTLDMVASLAAHRPMLGGINPHSGPIRVLYVDIENARADLRQRLDALGYGPKDLQHLSYYSFPSLPTLDSPSGGAHLLALAERDQPELIVLDTVSRIIGGEEDKADTFRALYRHSLMFLKAAGIAVLRLDHLGKDGTRGSRGSSAKADDVDTAWRLVNMGDGALRLLVDAQRTGHHPDTIELQRRTLQGLSHVRVDLNEDPRVAAVVRALDVLDLPLDVGRDRARAALAEAGTKARNEVLGRALAVRRELRELSRDSSSQKDQALIDIACPEEGTP